MTDRRQEIKRQDINLGKLPPQAVEMEKAVLGAYLIDPFAYDLNPTPEEFYYKDENRAILRIIKGIRNENEKVDLITVTQRLHDKGLLDYVGGPAYITGLATRLTLSDHVETHIKHIKEMYFRREAIARAYELLNTSYDPSTDFEDVVSSATKVSYSVLDAEESIVETIPQIGEKIVEKMNLNFANQGQVSGVRTGLSQLDNFTCGMQGGDLVVLGAESSQGKTALMISAVNNQMAIGCKIGVIGLEMTNQQLLSRIISQRTHISSKAINNLPLDLNESSKVVETIKSIEDKDVFFINKPNVTLDETISHIRRLKMKENVDIIYIDFLQRMRLPKGMNKVDGYAFISQQLKNVALELEIPIIVLSQLNRDREHPEPTMSRLRGSGEIEEAADVIMLLWRPEFFGLKTYEYKGENISTEGLAVLKLEKGRNIGIARLLLNWNPEVTQFTDYGTSSHGQFEAF